MVSRNFMVVEFRPTTTDHGLLAPRIDSRCWLPQSRCRWPPSAPTGGTGGAVDGACPLALSGPSLTHSEQVWW